jgi:hypothetical protein
MAQVTRQRDLESDIDSHLDYQFMQWRRVPEIAEWWPKMDTVEKEVFHLEWVGITEARLQELAGRMNGGAIRPDQRDRYSDLMRLVECHRPTVERLLAE